MAAALDGKVAPVVHEDGQDLGDIDGTGRLNATGWVNFLLLRVPDCEIIAAGVMKQRSEDCEKLSTLKVVKI